MPRLITTHPKETLVIQGEHSYWCQPTRLERKSYSPIDHSLLSKLVDCDQQLTSELINQSVLAFQQWRIQPAP